MKNLGKWISKNQGVFVALIISAALTVWIFGCESKVTSLTSSTKKVTGAELDLEVEAEAVRLQAELDQLMKRAELKHMDLRRQDVLKQKILDFALLTSQAGTLNASGMVGLLAGVLGVGAVVDNRIKDKVIKNRPLPKNPGVAT